MAIKDQAGADEQPAVHEDSREVVDDRVVAPRYWMAKPGGEPVAAVTEIDRVNLEAVGYGIVHDTPAGMPAATGGLA